ncbi:MAG: sulfatase [Bryobacteraceae bacterium]
MLRRDFIAASALSAVNPASAAESRKPNILFVLADQWRPQTLPSSGDPDLAAPNLARLAREGVHYNRVYATNPVCTPSRASILTGRYPHACRMPKNDLLLPLDEVCVAERLASAGYATGYIGKWHLDGEDRPGFVPPERRRGFQYWAAFNRGHFYFNSTYFRDSPDPIRTTGFEPDYQTDLAIDFIRRNRANPFYLFLSWGPPHTPRTPPPKYKDAYDPAQFHLRPNVPQSYAAQARKGLAGYYGLCSALDDNFGRLLAAVDEAGIAEDTLVVFTADHGDMVGSQGLEYKGVPYEESARIPLLMRYPRRLGRGEKSDLLISNADYMPTFLGLAGVEVPAAVQGIDQSEAMFAGKPGRRESLYAYGKLNTPQQWRMVVRGRDKLVVNASDEVTHLYNLADDPYEQTNLAEELAHARSRDELRAHLLDWRRRLGDRMDPSGLKTR